jgi:hypothetical protein
MIVCNLHKIISLPVVLGGFETVPLFENQVQRMGLKEGNVSGHFKVLHRSNFLIHTGHEIWGVTKGTYSTARTFGLNPTEGMDVCLRVSVLCLRRGHAIGRSPVQSVLPKYLKAFVFLEVNSELEKARGPNTRSVQAKDQDMLLG